MKKFSITLIIVYLLLGCSSNKLGEKDIEKQITEYIMKDGGDEISDIKNFKNNGFEKSEKVYIANVEYDLIFKKGFDEVAEKLKEDTKNSSFGAIMNSNFGTMALKMKYGIFKAGHTVQQKEKVTFINTEKGWRIDSIK